MYIICTAAECYFNNLLLHKTKWHKKLSFLSFLLFPSTFLCKSQAILSYISGHSMYKHSLCPEVKINFYCLLASFLFESLRNVATLPHSTWYTDQRPTSTSIKMSHTFQGPVSTSEHWNALQQLVTYISVCDLQFRFIFAAHILKYPVLSNNESPTVFTHFMGTGQQKFNIFGLSHHLSFSYETITNVYRVV
jgi:hypothetical protein